MMKKVLTTVQRVVVRRNDIIQPKRFLTSNAAGSRANMSSLPLAETGWEDPPADHFPPEEYRSSFEGTLEAVFEMNSLGKEASNFEYAVRSVTGIPSSKASAALTK
jgi:hypothetical protein